MADRPLTVTFLGDTTQLGESVKNIGSKFSGIKVAAGAAAAGAGVAISQGIANTLEFQTATAKLQAQLGGVNQMSKDAGQIAGNLYANAYGENLGQVNDAVKTVIQSGAVMEDASNEQIQSITAHAMSLSQTFGQDLGGTMKAVGQMMRTGLAPDAETAMDILTRGFQQGNDKAGDLLDTMNEYGTQFRKVGVDGTMAMGLIQQGLQAGARDSDIVADSIKEFSIRAVDGSKTTSEGFKAIGLDAADMAKKIAAGGPIAEAALNLTLQKLRDMKDPVQQSAAAVQLFGTQAEDMGKALYALDPSKAVAAMGDVAGAVGKVDKIMGDTAQGKITSMQRSWDKWTMSLVASDGPLGDVTASMAAFGAPVVGMAGNLAMVGVAFGPFSGKILGLAKDMALSVGRMVASGGLWVLTTAAQGAAAAASMAVTAAQVVASWVVMGVQATIQAAKQAVAWVIAFVAGAAMAVATMAATVLSVVAGWALMGVQSLIRAAQVAAAWVIAMGPVGWVIAGVIALVALIIANWDTVKRITLEVWSAVWGFIKQTWDTIVANVRDQINILMSVIDYLGALPGRVFGFFWGMVTAANDAMNSLVSWVAGLGGRVLGAIGNLGSVLYNAGVSLVSGFWNGIVDRWDALVSWFRNAMAGLRSYFPFSPAKAGPFSGSGYVDRSGEALTDDFARSIQAGMPAVAAAVSGIMNTAQGGLTFSPVAPVARAVPMSGSVVAGSAQPLQLTLSVGGGADQAVATLIMELIRTGKLQLQT